MSQQFQPQTIVMQAPRQSQALPALASFCLPGLGQLIQGRIGAALGWFFINAIAAISVVATIGIGLLWAIPIWIVCIMDAAKYRG